MLLDQLRQMNTSLNSIVAQFGAKRLRVFGSVARGEETSDSAVDFLVELPRGYDLFTQRMPLAQGLGDLLPRKVDLVPEQELNPHVRTQVLLKLFRYEQIMSCICEPHSGLGRQNRAQSGAW